MHLSERERTVLALIAHGSSDRAVALALDVKLATARKHRENIQQKLQAGKAAMLVWHYLRRHPGELKKSRMPRRTRSRRASWSCCCCWGAAWATSRRRAPSA